ncbi:MAG: hypothetical protein ABFD08_18695 [Syntrophomonas sp.]
MNKEEFLQLSIEARVEYVNGKLKGKKSIVQIANDLGINESTIRKPFTKNGYLMVNNQYALQEIQKQEADNDKEDTSIINMILDLQNRVGILEQHVIHKIQSDTISISLPESEEGMMSSRVNLEVMKQWREFTGTRREKAKDLFSMALWEFMINHK